MTDASLPWGTLFGLLFMTMGPIRAVAVFASFGESDEAPEVRALDGRAVGLVAIAFAIAVVIGDQAFTRWGVRLPALIAAAGIILIMLSLHAMTTPGPTATTVINVAEVRTAQVAFSGLFPPIAVALPINWLAMRYSKTIIRTIGPTPLQLLGAVFGVLQTALGVEFVIDAWQML